MNNKITTLRNKITTLRNEESLRNKESPNPNIEVFITRMLEMSTGHFPEEIIHTLEDRIELYPFTGFVNEYGIVLALPNKEEWPLFLEQMAGTPLDDPRFHAVINYALDHQCNWILADRDALALPDLAVYDW